MSNGTHLLERSVVDVGDGSRGGVCIIYQRDDHREPRMWNCRIKVSAERRYLYRACSTLDKSAATRKALQLYWEAQTLKKHGDTAKLWARPFKLVAEEWIRDIEVGVSYGIESLHRAVMYFQVASERDTRRCQGKIRIAFDRLVKQVACRFVALLCHLVGVPHAALI